MLRPERMSRVSVTGSKRVMDDTVEVLHSLDLLHISEYENAIDGFEPGASMDGADDVSSKLVTVRALENILDVGEDVAEPPHRVTDEEIDTKLAAVREEVNDLDDRRDDLRTELRDLEEKIEQLALFVDLGIDLDLLSGYDTLEVSVGEGDPESVGATLSDSDIDEYEVFAGETAVAAFARVDDRSALDDALVGATFTGAEIPEDGGDPESYLSELQERRAGIESDLDSVEAELDDLREEYGGFLLAVEEQLTIEAEKLEAPLSFATTANAFIAEGWMPTEEVDTLEAELDRAVGERIDVEELERAEYDEDGHVEEHEPVEGGAGGNGGATITEADAEEDEQEAPKAAADGGYVALSDDEPPVVQDNPNGVKPFEALVEVISRPKYTELDPTVILFMTFPAFFGFMIGDLGYGILYLALGYWVVSSFDNDVVKSLGGVAMWAGGFTALFGVLYGEFFGLHQLGGILWNGNPPIHKGLQPHYIYYAQGWLLLSVVVGVLHLVVGRLFDFVNNLDGHGLKGAVLESGSWIMMTVGLWTWVFSTQGRSAKPDFMFTVFDSGEKTALPLGFSGFDPVTLFTVPGLGFDLSLWLLVFFVGLVMAFSAEGAIAIIESVTQAFGHVVSYTRIAAVLLAKAGMALAVNLLVFGAYAHDGEFHLVFFNGMPENQEWLIFQGLLNLDGAVGLVLGLVMGLVILVLGHMLVLVLGITSAGLQAIRLEYVEFFGKFYEGGGTVYNPFGYDRTYTADE